MGKIVSHMVQIELPAAKRARSTRSRLWLAHQRCVRVQNVQVRGWVLELSSGANEYLCGKTSLISRFGEGCQQNLTQFLDQP